MKPFAKYLFIILIISFLFLGCTPPTLSPTQVPQEEPEVVINTESTPTEITSSASQRFTIQADEDLKAQVSALYEYFLPGETPTFVESDADLLATTKFKPASGPTFLPATFLPGAVLISQGDSSETADFISFAISPEGQQVLISKGYLPAVVTLTDQAGNTVEIAQPVQRLISAYGPATALLYSVDAEDRLISASYLGARDPMGATAMENIDPRFQEIMGDDYFTQQDFNVEQAASLNPDLIITSARTSWLNTVDELGISVFLFDAETPERLKEAVLLSGQLFGPHTTAQALAWVEYYDSIINSILEQTSSISEEEKIHVLFTGTDPLRVTSGEMYQTDIIEFAGGISVSADLSGYWNDINLEQVVIWDPDLIIVPPYGGASIEAITESEEWQILDAVQEGKVFRMPKLVVPWDTPAPASVLAIVWMAQLLYPDRVRLNCAEETEYFYNTFYNYAITAEEIDTICQVE